MYLNAKRTVLEAIYSHPGAMSPVMLGHMLRGEAVGRMAERGLLASPHFGALKELPGQELADAVSECIAAGLAVMAAGHYASLSLTRAGEIAYHAAQAEGQAVSPDESYQAYYNWRQREARRQNKPPYRVLTNQVLNELARRCPATLEELLMVPGLGKLRAMRYRVDLLEIGATFPKQPVRPSAAATASAV